VCVCQCVSVCVSVCVCVCVCVCVLIYIEYCICTLIHAIGVPKVRTQSIRPFDHVDTTTQWPYPFFWKKCPSSSIIFSEKIKLGLPFGKSDDAKHAPSWYHYWPYPFLKKIVLRCRLFFLRKWNWVNTVWQEWRLKACALLIPLLTVSIFEKFVLRRRLFFLKKWDWVYRCPVSRVQSGREVLPSVTDFRLRAVYITSIYQFANWDF
jgi:hypothetical protein